MFDNYLINNRTDQMTMQSEYFGEMFIRFGKCAEGITRARYIPFNSDGIRHIKDQIAIVKEARAELSIHLPYNHTITINNVQYEGISFEVRMFHDKSQLSIVTRGHRKGAFSDGMTDAARKKLSSELSNLIFDIFETMAEDARSLELRRFEKRAYAELQEAKSNIEKTLQFLENKNSKEAA